MFHLGPRTIFFWAPVCKWGLVVAGLADMTRPAQKLSVFQSGVLMTTGVLWSRWSLVIIPKNWFLFCCNCSLAASGIRYLWAQLNPTHKIMFGFILCGVAMCIKELYQRSK
uniref:Mitochondrial pyruvate carrier n=1 Tax=Esox lucius TaxID=8010 RepID=A0A3P8ZFK3_ESOLU